MWTEIIVILIGLLLLPVIIIVSIKLNKSIAKMDVTANMPIVENDYRKEFTGGYTLGTIKNIKQNKNGTKLVEFYPIDVEQGENVKIPHLQSVVVLNEYFKPFSIGELSDRRIRIKLITKEKSMIPKKLRSTPEGEWATKEGMHGYLKSEFGTVMKASAEALHEMTKDLSTLGLSAASIAQIKEKVKIIQEITPSQETQQKPKV